MRFLLFAILLGFPLLDIASLFFAAHKIGWWLAAWLVAAAYGGFYLIREERFAVVGRIAHAMATGNDPFRAMLVSGRLVLAGMLLIFPGVLSDALALVLLLIPGQGAPNTTPAAANDSVIDGEFRREE